MDTMTKVQIQDEAVYIAHRANTLRKGVNPIILLLAMIKS